MNVTDEASRNSRKQNIEAIELFVKEYSKLSMGKMGLLERYRNKI